MTARSISAPRPKLRGRISAAGTASATIDEYGIYQSAIGADTASVGLTNTGTLGIVAMATADMNDFAKANAYVDVGIYQYAVAANNYVSASALVDNNGGDLTILAHAKATGSAVYATATSPTEFRNTRIMAMPAPR